jgi:uncharacterized spore protein YtfJ
MRQEPADRQSPVYATLAEGFARLDAAARAESTVGTPRPIGDHTVIPLAEVYYGGGFGLGGGSAPQAAEGSGAGGGGGFGGRVRPVAVVDVGPNGARVWPVFDLTAIGLALVTVGLAAVAGRGASWRRRR